MDYKTAARLLLDLISPPKCILCGKTIPFGEKNNCLCERCAPKILGIIQPRFREVAIGSAKLRVLTLLPYSSNPENPVHKFISDIKNKRLSHHHRLASELIFESLYMLPLTEDTVIAYVPRSGKGKKSRGFDQMGDIAGHLAALSGFRVVPCMERRKETEQKFLSARERITSASRSFSVKRKYKGRLEGKSVLLIDDICTTGASVFFCAKALYDEGCRYVYPVCIASTERNDRL